MNGDPARIRRTTDENSLIKPVDENAEDLQPKIALRIKPNPMLMENIGKIQSSKSSVMSIKLDNAKRTLLDASIRETSSFNTNKRRKV